MTTTFSPPYYKVCVGGDSKWLTTLHTGTTEAGDLRQVKVEAETRAEMVYNILCDVSGSAPTYDSFIRWYCYPSQSITMTTLAGQLELQRQLLPLQNHVDRQMFNNRVQCVLEVFCSHNILDYHYYDLYLVYHLYFVCNVNISFQSREPTIYLCWGLSNGLINFKLGPKIDTAEIYIENWQSESKKLETNYCNLRQTLNIYNNCVFFVELFPENRCSKPNCYFRVYLLRGVS